MVALSALVSGLDAELVRLGYKDSTMVWYRGCWRRLQRYFAVRGVEEFSLDVAMAWVDDACGFFDKEQAGTLKRTDVYLFRVAQMLGEYEAHGAVLRRYSRTVGKLTGDGAAAVARFEASLRAAGRSASTVRAYGTLAGEFAAFAGTRGGIARCDAGTLEAFVATLAGYQVKTVEQKLCAVRSFLRFAAAAGLVDAAVLDAVPAVRSSKQARVPSVWDPGDVARIVEAIDRSNPCGKRDYAIILLITRLGLRGVDARRLEFADFDWPGNRLSIVQAKTGHRVQLPLLKEVGWAVIDYIRHGRPACDCPQVFLRHLAPIGPFSDQDHLHQILVKHARVAHVRVSEKRRHGMHSLRHTLATRLKMGRIAFDASFGSSREHALPAAQRAALRWRQPAGRHGGCGDLGLHGPPVSDATTMRLMPLRGLHHRCGCWHRDTSGCSRRRRMHHGVPGEWRRGGRGCCADPGLPARDTRPDLGVHNLGCGGCQDVASDPIVPNVFTVAVDALACGGCWCPGRERPRGRLRWSWWTARRRCGPRPRCSRRCWRAGGASRWRGG
jgi:integrase